MGMIRGITASTKENLLLGAGAFYKNFIVGTDTPTNTTGKAKLLGATDGGGTFAAVPAVRQVTVDGAPGPIIGLETNDGYAVTMTANVKEATVKNMSLALGMVTVDTATTGQTKIVGNVDIKDADYADNITWCGSLSNGDFVYIVLKNALSTNGLNLTFTDKNEGTIPLTITGHYDIDDLDTPPFEIYYIEN